VDVGLVGGDRLKRKLDRAVLQGDALRDCLETVPWSTVRTLPNSKNAPTTNTPKNRNGAESTRSEMRTSTSTSLRGSRVTVFAEPPPRVRHAFFGV
jgi:hypothetical protein